MKIIDQTSQQDAKGNISIVARIRGTLKYGLSWYPDLEAQKLVIAQLERLLERGFVLIRNFNLPGSEIVIPLILLGAGGVWVIYVTSAKGNFEARGDQWNTVNNDGKAMPASINYITRVAQLGTVFQKFLKIQKVDMPCPVEAVLIAADPGAQIESNRPMVRVVRSDALKQFAGTLLQARPVWRTDFIHDLADRILEAIPPQELKPLTPGVVAGQAAPRAEQGFNPNDLGFAFDESQEQPVEENAPSATPLPPAPARQLPAKKKKRLFGLSDTQIIILAGLGIAWLCVLFGLVIILSVSL
ncbi:MAG: hypothetical protein HY865_03720 [Chloroflexi bacterium]|nr:hypothetical protein [Chloroflexota bacterium]